MEYLVLSLIAGVLTILSPCVLPMLPVIVGGSLTNQNKWRPVIITISLAVSLVLFALLLKASTLLINVPRSFWQTISGVIILFFGLITLYPQIWEQITIKLGFTNTSNTLLSRIGQRQDWLGSVLIGVALGPVFSSCSPTYSIVIATVLPESFIVGLLNLILYAVGLAGTLMLIAVFGQRIISRVKWAANPEGNFRKILGIIFIVIGMAIILGIDKRIETWFIENGYLGTTLLEQELVDDRI